MFRQTGISNAFKKATSADEDREIGQLMHITEDGEATHEVGDGVLAFPLVDKFDASDDQAADLQVSGVAKVWVETYTGIEAGLPVAIGSTGVGVKLAVAGDMIIGMALKKPTVNSQTIPVLLGVIPKTATLY